MQRVTLPHDSVEHRKRVTLRVTRHPMAVVPCGGRPAHGFRPEPKSPARSVALAQYSARQRDRGRGWLLWGL